MRNLGKVKEDPNWIRNDIGTLVNTDSIGYKNYMQKKRLFEEKSKNADDLKDRVDSLSSEITDINSKMNKILELLTQRD